MIAAPAPWCWWTRQGRHQAVNACILFLPALDGQQLLTVEHLAAADGGAASGAAGDGGSAWLAMRLLHAGLRDVDVRACGPRAAKPDRAAINEALAGNLCRCTGYRPIVDAAMDVCTGS